MRLVDSSPGRGAVAAGGRAAHGGGKALAVAIADCRPGCYA